MKSSLANLEESSADFSFQVCRVAVSFGGGPGGGYKGGGGGYVWMVKIG